ncbi:hypothetical protein CSUB01_10196 [Colletotrichum sublineola]|uniref:Uncharacterized protein n=1 Tax=Colletotrichum sublineola TaxID=1173701 RepID=A0A066XQV9_COLSU|nr:hypothetical protein CSUB01_10196 [Colletotrichum sublineola]
MPRAGPSTVPSMPGIKSPRLFSPVAATPKPTRRPTPSAPPMPQDGHESDISISGIVVKLLTKPFLPLSLTSKKSKALRAKALAEHKAKEKKLKAAESLSSRRSGRHHRSPVAHNNQYTKHPTISLLVALLDKLYKQSRQRQLSCHSAGYLVSFSALLSIV